jgi:hypothetical protein
MNKTGKGNCKVNTQINMHMKKEGKFTCCRCIVNKLQSYILLFMST